MTPAPTPTRISYVQSRPVLVRQSAVLHVVSGPDVGASCEMGEGRVVIGTAPSCTLVVSDPGVSRRHMEFRVVDQGYQATDLDSTNGTFFRGARIQVALVGLGAELRLSKTVVRIEPRAETTGVPQREQFGSLIGCAPPMQELYGVLAAVAPTDTTVLLEGETGTGKELISEEIHRQSPRKHHQFMILDCAAIAEGLIESELFGHERGAFSGADTTREGIFERARGGTVLLDEIGELPLEMQTRLLRVLDRRTVKRVGSNRQREVISRVAVRHLSRSVTRIEIVVVDEPGNVRHHQQVEVGAGADVVGAAEDLFRAAILKLFPPSVAEPEPEPEPEPERAKSTSGRLWTWIAAGACGAALAAGVTFGVLATSTHDEWQSVFEEGTDEQRWEDLRSTGERQSTASVALIAVGGALAAAATVLFFLEGPSRESPDHGARRWRPSVAHGGGGLVVTF